jgi:hypothetical protein
MNFDAGLPAFIFVTRNFYYETGSKVAEPEVEASN